MAKSEISSNEITLQAYEADVSSYLKFTPATYDISHRDLLKWIDTSLAMSGNNAKILEIGSGSGRDALYIKSKGYSITCSDAVQGFIHHLQTLPLKTIKLDLLKNDVPKSYSVIFANAVFPHFNKDETIKAVHKIYDSLPVGGILAFNVKQGFGSLWITEKLKLRRFVKLWQPQDIIGIATKAGFILVYKKSDVVGDLKTHTWTQLTFKKS